MRRFNSGGFTGHTWSSHARKGGAFQVQPPANVNWCVAGRGSRAIMFLQATFTANDRQAKRPFSSARAVRLSSSCGPLAPCARNKHITGAYLTKLEQRPACLGIVYRLGGACDVFFLADAAGINHFRPSMLRVIADDRISRYIRTLLIVNKASHQSLLFFQVRVGPFQPRLLHMPAFRADTQRNVCVPEAWPIAATL
jgi:hypothetical protein